MKYLARALGGASGAIRPITPSRSPLAEADQRLHLDGVAAAYEVGAGMSQDAAAESLVEIDHGAPGLGSLDASRGTSGARRASEPTMPRTPSRSPVRTSRAEVVPDRRGVPLRVRGPVVVPGAAAASPSITSPEDSRPGVTTTTTRAVPPDYPPRLASDLMSSGVPRPSLESSASKPEASASSAGSEPSLDRALAQVAAWLKRPGTAARPAQPIERDPSRLSGSPPSVVAGRSSAPDPELASVTAQAAPRLEIGTIEVELVSPAPRPVRARSESRRAESPGSPSRPFGWRQS